ncbi:MAG: 4-hydroxythreonine-4-phosphate dehydrogenase PdxA, partial [Paracoccaceae bacterium]|nr:4-hydroxythreonine-4-phosphate dehydrogenase PdxA [Paracoccaceae bacterium]
MSCTPIAITMGDPSGVGAEVIVKAMASLSEHERRLYAVIGDVDTLSRAIRICGADLRLSDTANSDALQVVHIPVEGLPRDFGILSDACGEASFRYIERAVEMCSSGMARGIVTAPINKAALNAAGHHYDGHT